MLVIGDIPTPSLEELEHNTSRGALRDYLGGLLGFATRTRLLGPQAELFPGWRHFAFVTNRTEDIALGLLGVAVQKLVTDAWKLVARHCRRRVLPATQQ